MNLLIFQPSDAQFRSPDHRSGDLLVTGRQRQHLNEVHRATQGDTVRVGLLGGWIGTATILAIDPQAAKLEFSLHTPPPAPLPTTLLLGLPRPKMLKRTLQTIATMGVKTVYLINSYRVEKSYWQTPFLTPDAIQHELILGLEQGVDTLLPTVHLRTRFKPFVEDELPTLMSGKQALLAHPGEQAAPCPTQIANETLLAIGPEGGFISYEVDRLKAAGFEQISLGQRILRVETAVPVLLAKLFS